MSTGTAIGNPEKVAVNEHCKLRQSSEMVQSPEVARDKVWFLTLLREAHIWDRVTLGGQVGGSDGGVGVGKGAVIGGSTSGGYRLRSVAIDWLKNRGSLPCLVWQRGWLS